MSFFKKLKIKTLNAQKQAIQVRIQQALQSGLWDSFDEEEKEDFVFGAMIMETNMAHTVDTENFKRELLAQINWNMVAVITEEFRKSLRKLNNKEVNERVLETIENVENALTLSDIRGLKKLKGYQTAYRIRIGDFRIGLHIAGNVVHFNRVANRKNIYDEFP